MTISGADPPITQKLNVAFFPSCPPSSFQNGGGALAIWQTAKALALHPDLSVHIIFKEDEPVACGNFPPDLHLISLNNESKKEIDAVLDTISPDIVHALYCRLRPAIKWAKDHNVPSLFEVRVPRFWPCRFSHALKMPGRQGWRALWFGRKERKTAELADMVVVPSASALSDLRLHYGISEYHSDYAHNGINFDTFKPKNESILQNRPLHIINAGRISAGKNFDMVIRIYQRLHQIFPGLHLDLVGDGEVRAELEQMCHKLGLTQVRFHGVVSHDRLATLYQQADLLLNTSRAESFGNVVAEAMACGLPVVAFSVGSLPELVDDGKAGFLNEYPDENAHFERARQLLRDETMRESFGLAAAESVRRKFSWEKRAEKLVSIYHELLRSKTRTMGSRA